MQAAISPTTGCLLRAIRIVINADSDPARQVLFANLMQARPGVRLAFRAHAVLAGTWASAVLVSGYGLAYFLRIRRPGPTNARVLAVAKHANARRQIDRVSAWLGAGECVPVPIGFSPGAALQNLTTLVSSGGFAGIARTLRVVRRVDRRWGFLVACRVAAAIAWYARAKTLLDETKPGAVLVSSDSNPEEAGFTAAARRIGVPRVFIAHAYPTPFAPPLDFELSILEGHAAVRARAARGPVRGDIVLAGVEGESMPLDASRLMRPDPVIGIFAPKAVAWPTLQAIVSDCRERFGARQIVIRWHPSRLDPARRLHELGDLSGIVESPVSATLADVARLCDWVIADENSNVHLPVLKMGIPTVAVKRLGLYPPSRSDMYGFAAARVIHPPVDAIREMDPASFAAFFSEGWIDRFRQYDASYLRPPSEVGLEVRDAIWRLWEAPSRQVTVA